MALHIADRDEHLGTGCLLTTCQAFYDHLVPYECLSVHVSAGAGGSQKRASDPLDLGNGQVMRAELPRTECMPFIKELGNWVQWCTPVFVWLLFVCFRGLAEHRWPPCPGRQSSL